jgi:hypothetical protein
MAAEAVPAVVAGSEAAAGGSAAAATEAGGGASGTGYFGGVTAAPRAPKAPGGPRAGGRSATGRPGAPAGRRKGSRRQSTGRGLMEAPALPSSGRPVVGPGSDVHFDLGVGWHRVVMAEFLAAILILVLAPILTPDQGGNSKGFFKAADIVRMTAVCLVYFILALMTNGQRIGKAAAAFGGLVLTGIVINNATGTESIFAALASIFSSAFGANNASATTEVTDPDLVYGQVGANVFQQLTAGGTPTPGATATVAPAAPGAAALTSGAGAASGAAGAGAAAGPTVAPGWQASGLTGLQ